MEDKFVKFSIFITSICMIVITMFVVRFGLTH